MRSSKRNTASGSLSSSPAIVSSPTVPSFSPAQPRNAQLTSNRKKKQQHSNSSHKAKRGRASESGAADTTAGRPAWRGAQRSNAKRGDRGGAQSTSSNADPIAEERPSLPAASASENVNAKCGGGEAADVSLAPAPRAAAAVNNEGGRADRQQRGTANAGRNGHRGRGADRHPNRDEKPRQRVSATGKLTPAPLPSNVDNTEEVSAPQVRAEDENNDGVPPADLKRGGVDDSRKAARSLASNSDKTRERKQGANHRNAAATTTSATAPPAAQKQQQQQLQQRYKVRNLKNAASMPAAEVPPKRPSPFPSESQIGVAPQTREKHGSVFEQPQQQQQPQEAERHQTEAADSSLTAPPVLPQDPAIVDHYMSVADPDGDAEAMRVVAALPPDPCLVKVVSASVVAVLPASPPLASSTQPPDAPSPLRQEKKVVLVAETPDTMTVTTAAATAVAVSSPVSEEDALLSRRGLRYEAAPWKPPVAFAFDVEHHSFPSVTTGTTTTAGGSGAVDAGEGPSLHRLGALGIFAAPAPATRGVVLNGTLPPAVTTGTASVLLGGGDGESALLSASKEDAVPAVTITSTLVKPDSAEAPPAPQAAAAPTTASVNSENILFTRMAGGAGGVRGGPAMPVTVAAVPPGSSTFFSTQPARMASPGSFSQQPQQQQPSVSPPGPRISVLGGSASFLSRPPATAAGDVLVHSPHSLLESPASSTAHSPSAILPDSSSPLGNSVGSASSRSSRGRSTPASEVVVGAVFTAGPALTPHSFHVSHANSSTPPLPASTGGPAATPAGVVVGGGVWGMTHSSSPPSSVMREDDGDSSSNTPILTSPALEPTLYGAGGGGGGTMQPRLTLERGEGAGISGTASSSPGTSAAAGISGAAAGDGVEHNRPVTAPAVRRSAMTVTNTATGARMSSSSLTTPSGSPMGGGWAVTDGTTRPHMTSTNTATTAANVVPPPATTTTTAAAETLNLSGGGGSGSSVLSPSWPSSGYMPSAASLPIHSAGRVRSAGTADYSTREFPAMPFTAAAAAGAPNLHAHVQQPYHALSGFPASGGSHANLSELNTSATGAIAATTASLSPTNLHSPPAGSTGAGQSHSNGSSYSGSPQLSLQNSSSMFLSSNLQYPRSATTPGGHGGFSQQQQQQTTYAPAFGPAMNGESDLDRVRHNRVAVSDVAAKNETTLLHTLFADAEADVIEDDESEMDMDEGLGSGAAGSGGGEWWPAYPRMGTSPYTRQQQPQQHSFVLGASPTVGNGAAETHFGGGYWNQAGVAGGSGNTRTSGSGSGNAGGGHSRSRFSPNAGVHRAVSTSCASVASSTMSLLDPRQPPPTDFGAAVYDLGTDEEEWEMNSSAYADSLDEAQIQWIEEQLKATENPVGYF